MEADFFVTDEALQHLQLGVGSEQADLLRAFDLHRARILEAAAGSIVVNAVVHTFWIQETSSS